MSKINNRVKKSLIKLKEEQLRNFREIEQKRLDLEKERNANPKLFKDSKQVKLPKKPVNKNKIKRDKKKSRMIIRQQNTSKGELCILNYLNSIKVKFKREVTFNDLFNPITEQLLRFDFYLPDYNLAIEFDGAQHFMYVPDFHGKDRSYGLQLLEAQQYRDRIKNNYCEWNKINLLRISYREIDDIKNMINKKLKELKRV